MDLNKIQLMEKLKKRIKLIRVTVHSMWFLKEKIKSQSMETKYAKKIQTSGPNLKNLSLITVLIFSSLFVITFDNVYGHGVGSEILPPVELNGRLVTLEISSSQKDPNTNDDQQISISLIDFNSKITLRDVTFLIKSERGEQFLFEQEFNANNGFLVFNFISEEMDSIIVDEVKNSGSFFNSLFGLESRMINVKGSKLNEGGLYKFNISVITADSKKLEEPLVFNAGISIAQTTQYEIDDPNFGMQNIHVTTYYDEISDFEYDPNSKEISFSMPFQWTEFNINQTSVIHEELVISKSFGDLLVSGFTIYVNGVKLSEDVVIIDDFSTDHRTIHFMISQKELLHIFEDTTNQNKMNFLIKPVHDDIYLNSVTENGQFRILVSWEPENLKSDSNAKIIFDVTDVLLKNRPISTNYEFSITQDNGIIFEQNGISTNSKDNHNVIEFMIPEYVSGIINLNFNNLDNNNLAKTTIPVVVNRIINQNDEITIPSWVKNNAGWWSTNQTSDLKFLEGIDFLFEKQIVSVPSRDVIAESQWQIPQWVKIPTGWWSEEKISDMEFLNIIENLVKRSIIVI